MVALTDNDTTNEYELLDVEDSKYYRGMNSSLHILYMAVDISHFFAFTIQIKVLIAFRCGCVSKRAVNDLTILYETQ